MAAVFLDTPQGRRLAHHRTAGTTPGVIFLGGFRSDMTGTKAMFLQDRAKRLGHAFVRFDYSGHGESTGRFEEGAIGDWAEDAAAILASCEGPQVLVGSSMGGWIALLLAKRFPDRVAALVGIAAAPDFTEDLVWPTLSEPERHELASTGQLLRPSIYADAPYVYTRRLLEDGRDHLVLRHPLILPFPVRLLQGTLDDDVPPAVALRLIEHAESPDMRLTLVKGADHRFSSPECLDLIDRTLTGLGV